MLVCAVGTFCNAISEILPWTACSRVRLRRYGAMFGKSIKFRDLFRSIVGFALTFALVFTMLPAASPPSYAGEASPGAVGEDKAGTSVVADNPVLGDGSEEDPPLQNDGDFDAPGGVLDGLGTFGAFGTSGDISAPGETGGVGIMAANPLATRVRLNLGSKDATGVFLSASQPYLVNGAASASGTLNGTTCRAWFNAATGTLTLQNYDGGMIEQSSLGGGPFDITIKLVGNNTVTVQDNANTAYGIYNKSGGDTTITSDATATLTINVTITTQGSAIGISTNNEANGPRTGDITMSGKADIKVIANSTGFRAIGLYAYGDVNILNDASFSAVYSSTTTNELVTGILSAKLLTINTTGDILLDGSNSINKSPSTITANGATPILTKAGTLTQKWKAGGGAGGRPAYNAGDFVVTSPDAYTRVYTWGKLPVDLAPGSGKITFYPPVPETGYSFYYASGASAITAPQSSVMNDFTGLTNINSTMMGGIDINGPNGTPIYVRLYKIDSAGVVLTSFGQTSATPGTTITNPPEDRVVINIVSGGSGQQLDAQYPYLRSNGTKASSGTLGVDSVARFDASTGTLTLQGYNHGGIKSIGLGGRKDFAVKLVGSNTITNTSNNVGLWHDNHGDLLITSDAPGGSLAVNVNRSSTNLMGIATTSPAVGTPGDVTIGGYASVSVNVTNTLGVTRGISSNMNLNILDNASVNVTCKTPLADSSAVSALWAESGAVTINTAGNVNLDCYYNKTSSMVIRTGNPNNRILTKVGTLTLKWPENGSQGVPKYDPVDFAVSTNNTTRTATYTYAPKTPLTFTAEQVGGASGTASSTGIRITFSQPVSGAFYDDIVIKGNVVQGAMTGSGTTWTIDLTNVASEGVVTVSVKNTGVLSLLNYYITTPEQAVQVYKNAGPSTYNMGDIYAINGIIQNNDLGWPYYTGDGNTAPSGWYGVTWSSDSANKRITGLDVGSEDLTGSLIVTALTKLDTLKCNNNNLTGLYIYGLQDLYEVFCGENELTGLYLSDLPNLTALYCQDNEIGSLPLYGVLHYGNLEYLNCSKNYLTSLDITGLPMADLDCSYNNMTGTDDVIGFAATWGKTGSEGYVFLPQNAAVQAITVGSQLDTLIEGIPGTVSFNVRTNIALGSHTAALSDTITGSLPDGISIQGGSVVVSPNGSGTLILIGNTATKAGTTDTLALTLDGSLKSPMFALTIDKAPTPPLVFNYSSSYDVPAGKVGASITTIDVSGGVTGGEGSYTFSMGHGPEWLSVSADGKITGTRPASSQGATIAGITVEDGEGRFDDIIINVGAVTGGLIKAEALEGVTSPVALATPSTAISGGTGFAATLSWDGSPSSFTYSTVYTATIRLTAETDYTFSGGFTDKLEIAGFTVNGIAPTEWVSNGGTELVFKVTFPATLAEGMTGVAAVSATIMAPVVGAKPVFMAVVPAGDEGKYTAEVVGWYALDGWGEVLPGGMFRAGTSYSVEVRFIPEAGYSFTASTTATINGSEAVFEGIYDDTALFSTVFTAAAEAVSGMKSYLVLPVQTATHDLHALLFGEAGIKIGGIDLNPADFDIVCTAIPKSNKTATLTTTGALTAKAPGTVTANLSLTGKTGLYAGWSQKLSVVVRVATGLEKITVSQAAEKKIAVKKTFTPKLTYTPANASITSAVWTSSNPAVASVHATTGKVTAVSPGVANINLKVVPWFVSDKAAEPAKTEMYFTWSYDVYVPATAVNIKRTVGGKTEIVNGRTLRLLPLGGTATLGFPVSIEMTAEGGTAEAAKEGITWSTNAAGKKIVSLTPGADGKVTVAAVSENSKGTATLTAKAAGGKTATVKINVGKLAAVDVARADGLAAPIVLRIGETTTSAAVGGTIDLAAIAPAGITKWTANNNRVTFAPDPSDPGNPDKVRVTGVKAGAATITATDANKKTAKIKVTVVQPVTSIAIKNKPANCSYIATPHNMKKGQALTLKTTLSGGATNKKVAWSSNNTAVATVNSSGKITAIGDGIAIISLKPLDNDYVAHDFIYVRVSVPATKVVVEQSKFSMVQGTQAKLSAATTPTSALLSSGEEAINWTSNNALITFEGSDTGSSVVIKTGDLPANKSSQKVKLTAAVKSGKKATIEVTVSKSAQVVVNKRITKTVTWIKHGKSETLKLAWNEGKDAKGKNLHKAPSNKNVHWTIEEYDMSGSKAATGSVAIVDAKGKVTATGAGSAIVTATTVEGPAKFSSSCRVISLAKP